MPKLPGKSVAPKKGAPTKKASKQKQQAKPKGGYKTPDITDVRLTVMEDAGNLLAMASITLGNAFVVGGLRVVNGSKGVFVSMPSRKDDDGEYHDIAFPLSKAGREVVTKAVIDAYEKE